MVAGARVARAMRGYEPHVILFHYPAVKLAEKEGFEPSEDFVLGSLAKICLKPLGHPSSLAPPRRVELLLQA